MLAAVLPDYGPASRLKVQLIDLPRLPLGKLKASEIVVEVHAASVNPTDWKQRKGTLAALCPLNLPTILGIDFAGVVVRAGEESRFSEGEEVRGSRVCACGWPLLMMTLCCETLRDDGTMHCVYSL